MPRLSGMSACVFDAYGTLFDFGSAAASCRDVLGEKTGALTALWRDKQLQYTWLRTLQGDYVPFRQVTGDALDFALRALGLEDAGLRPRLMALYDTLDPFPEVAEVLAALKTAGFVTAILSNGSPDMLAPLVARPGIGARIDHVLSVDAVRKFKTHPSVYHLAVDRLGVAAEEICFFSSNGWDAWAASAFGFRAIWCNRSGQPPEILPGEPEAIVGDLREALPLLT
jgi:2-haloacid dehalogenase